MKIKRKFTQLVILSVGASLFASVAQAGLIFDEGLNNGPAESIIYPKGFKAHNFTMGSSNGGQVYLSSITLGLGSFIGTVNPLVQLWSDNSGALGTSLQTLTNPSTLTASAVNTFTSSGYQLTPGNTYWVVVGNQSPVIDDYFGWFGSNELTIASSNGTTHTAQAYGDIANLAGFEYKTGTAGTLNRMQITTVPEPSTAIIGSIGVLALLRRRRK